MVVVLRIIVSNRVKSAYQAHVTSAVSEHR